MILFIVTVIKIKHIIFGTLVSSTRGINEPEIKISRVVSIFTIHSSHRV